MRKPNHLAQQWCMTGQLLQKHRLLDLSVSQTNCAIAAGIAFSRSTCTPRGRGICHQAELQAHVCPRRSSGRMCKKAGGCRSTHRGVGRSNPSLAAAPPSGRLQAPSHANEAPRSCLARLTRREGQEGSAARHHQPFPLVRAPTIKRISCRRSPQAIGEC